MDPALPPSRFLAEACTLSVLLAGTALLYRSFREKYLAPWIAGWIAYSLSRLLTAYHGLHPESVLWAALAQACFAIAVGLFSSAVFRYVDRPNWLLPAQGVALLAAMLGVAKELWFPEAAALRL